MTGLTEAQKLAFGEWITTLLNANKETLENADPDIPFPVNKYVKALEKKHTKFKEDEGELARLIQQKREQTKTANNSLKDYYETGSKFADAAVSRMGKDHELSKLIRNKRDLMVIEKARGKKEKPTE